MKYKIINNCVNCGGCLIVCPAKAISKYNSKNKKLSVQGVRFFIISDSCNNCDGYSDIPLCIEICPMDSIKQNGK